MSLDTYANLQASVLSAMHRTGDAEVTALVPDWIVLAESTMQEVFDLLSFDVTASIAITSGVGTIPSDYQGARSAYWDGTTSYSMQYIPPELFDARRNISADVPTFYTVTGTSIEVSPSSTGTMVLTYSGQLTSLSNSNPTNYVLANHAECYLYGTLFHGAIWSKDPESMQTYGTLFNAAMDRVKTQDESRKYPGNLQVRPR